jgi:hypothetical protein
MHSVNKIQTSRVNEVLSSADMLQIMLNENNGDITTKVKSLLMRPFAEWISTHYADMQHYIKWLFWDVGPCSLVETERRFRDVSYRCENLKSHNNILFLLKWHYGGWRLPSHMLCATVSRALFRAQSVHDSECSAAAVMWWVPTNRTLPDVSVWKRRPGRGWGMQYQQQLPHWELRGATRITLCAVTMGNMLASLRLTKI